MNETFNNFDTVSHSSGARPGDTCQFVNFTLGTQQFCVDIMSVREIRTSNVVTPLPSAPDFVRGVINLRGTIVPIIDLRARFALGRTEPAQSNIVIIVMIGGRLNGILVDTVSDIITVRSSEIAAIPETPGESRNPYFDGLIMQGNSMLIVIGLERLLSSTIATDERPADNRSLYSTQHS